jgi:hypothetical protein
MRLNSRLIIFIVSALLLTISKKWPNNSKNKRYDGEDKTDSADHGQQPATEVPQSEWTAFQSTIREIHESEKRHQKAERDLGAAQLRTAKGLNRITIIGAIFSFVGLLGVAASLIIARRAAEDGRVAADAVRNQAKVLADQERKQLRGYFGHEGFSLTCGDCTPTENDQITLSMENFGQTPITVLSGVVGIVEYTLGEPFPEDDQTRSIPQNGIQSLFKSIVVYPRSPKTAYFPITTEMASQIKEVKEGSYWMMFRVEVSYTDIFNDTWYNYSCFMLDVRRKGEPNRFVGCPEYNEERNANNEQPPPMIPSQIIFPDILFPVVPDYEVK